MMEGTEAFGGGKVGGSFDPLNFLKKPCVVFRIAALVRNDHIVDTFKRKSLVLFWVM